MRRRMPCCRDWVGTCTDGSSPMARTAEASLPLKPSAVTGPSGLLRLRVGSMAPSIHPQNLRGADEVILIDSWLFAQALVTPGLKTPSAVSPRGAHVKGRGGCRICRNAGGKLHTQRRQAAWSSTGGAHGKAARIFHDDLRSLEAGDSAFHRSSSSVVGAGRGFVNHGDNALLDELAVNGWRTKL